MTAKIQTKKHVLLVSFESMKPQDSVHKTAMEGTCISDVFANDDQDSETEELCNKVSMEMESAPSKRKRPSKSAEGKRPAKRPAVSTKQDTKPDTKQDTKQDTTPTAKNAANTAANSGRKAYLPELDTRFDGPPKAPKTKKAKNLTVVIAAPNSKRTKGVRRPYRRLALDAIQQRHQIIRLRIQGLDTKMKRASESFNRLDAELKLRMEKPETAEDTETNPACAVL